MRAVAKAGSQAHDADRMARRVAQLESADPVGGFGGPGRWLVAEVEPVALFSLKISSATSSVGRTLVIPTPDAIKMSLVDAGFRAGLTDRDCDALLRALRQVDVRIGPSRSAVVTHTFVKVRQETRSSVSLGPYNSNIAYRDVAYLSGATLWAFDLVGGDAVFAEQLIWLLPHVSYIGKRGSFVRLLRCYRASALGLEFTQPLVLQGQWSLPPRAHIVPLDDLGPEADLETLSSFTPKRPRPDRHRRFIQIIVPVGIVNTGPAFTEYSRE
jgi:hypothetical protein